MDKQMLSSSGDGRGRVVWWDSGCIQFLLRLARRLGRVLLALGVLSSRIRPVILGRTRPEYSLTRLMGRDGSTSTRWRR